MGASRGALEFYTAWGGIPRYWELAVAVAADQLHAQVPKELPTGQVRLIVLLSGEDDAGGMWAHGINLAVGQDGHRNPVESRACTQCTTTC